MRTSPAGLVTHRTTVAPVKIPMPQVGALGDGDAARLPVADQPVERPGRPPPVVGPDRTGGTRGSHPRQPTHPRAPPGRVGAPHWRPPRVAPRTLAAMRATSIGHAGVLVETRAGSILCDPWFVPRLPRRRGSRSPATTNSPTTCGPASRLADFLYVSHLHGDHHDEPWLRSHLRRDIPVLLPGFPPPRSSSGPWPPSASPSSVRTVDTEELEIAPGLTVAIHIEVVDHRRPRRRTPPWWCRTASRSWSTRTTAGPTTWASSPATGRSISSSSSSPAPSGTRWSTRCPDAEKARLCRAKVESQFSRAMRYVEKVGARYVVPSAGPPCFLDPRPLRPQRPSTAPRPRSSRTRPSSWPAWRPAATRGCSTSRARPWRSPPPGSRSPIPCPRTRWRRSSRTRAPTCAATRPTGRRGWPTSRPGGTPPPPTCSPR